MEENTPETSTSNTVDQTRPQGNAPRSNSENSNFRTTGSNSSGSSGYGGKPISSAIAEKDINRTMEGSTSKETIANAVDSAYSQSNSRSLSSESSQCRMRGSNSSGSSGYGGKQTQSISAAQAENSASSGNSAELTTIKDLKRSKNKGRKKKAKTKQLQNRPIEPVQETKSHDAKPSNEKTTSATFEPQTITADTINPEDIPSNAESKISRIIEVAPENQTTEAESLQKELPTDNKPITDANPLNSSESNEKQHQKPDEFISKTDKLDDLEVDTILSYSKVEQQTTDHRTVNLTQESFCCAISMHDGVILSTTANLTDSLGFPKDVWLGRAFIEFIHPKDRPTFASQITSSYIDRISLKEDYLRQSNFEKTPLYVRLRCYRGFDACGFDVKNKPISYKPFKLIFRKPPEMPSNSLSASDSNCGLRIICAIALSSIYKVPEEAVKNLNAKFSTRHTAAGILVHIDGCSVAAIGYMPQDIIGKSILEFFHPEDTMLLKTAYEILMKNGMERVSSPPYRFLIKNGCYITLETEWTRVFNPWSRKLEFVTGDHCVSRGPKYCDIFTKTGKYACKFPNDILEKAVKLRKELLKLLSEPVPYPSDSVKQQVSKRCQALAHFMESLLIGVNRQELKLDLLGECEAAASEHGSVMLGEISPHHHSNNSNHGDSKSSSETPPTYNQLNYFENLNRFFNSVQPIFVPNEFKSLPYQIDHVPTNEKDRMLSPIQQCGEESGGSFNSSSDSPQFESTNTSNTSNNKNTTQQNVVQLTEALVSRHTDEMEVQMVKNHKKYRTRITDKKKAPDKCNSPAIRNQSIKRSWPNDCGNDTMKNSKSQNQNEHRYTSNLTVENAQNDEKTAQQKKKPENSNDDKRSSTNHTMGSNNVHAVHLWPPFSVNASTTQNNTSTNTTPKNFNQFLLSNHFPTPRYYVSPINSNGILTKTHQTNEIAASLPNPYALNYMKNLMYQTRPFVHQNMTYPYTPIAYQPLLMPIQKTTTTAKATNVLQTEMKPSTSQHAIWKMPDQLPNMESILYRKFVLHNNIECIENIEPVNLSTNTDENIPKLQVKPRANMKEDNSEEVDASNSSFSSSFFDSQIRTDESWESDKTSKDDTIAAKDRSQSSGDGKKRGKIPHWMKNIESTPELIFRYQLRSRELEDTLQADMRVLKEINQPGMVNEQLDQLYLELDLENEGKVATISLGDTPINSSEDEENMSKNRKNTHFSKMSLIYEENAPLQPSVDL